jgi:hypothetical protein
MIVNKLTCHDTLAFMSLLECLQKDGQTIDGRRTEAQLDKSFTSETNCGYGDCG